MREMQPGQAVTPSIRLVRRLGAGGMGSVWLAEHLSLRTHVVVKFMAVELAASSEAVDRFSREAASAAQVKSPHVVQMLDHGVTPDGVPFIAMELLEGQDLGKALATRGRLSIHETAEIIGQVCKALSRAHERGIVHRDIKPENIFLCAGSDGETFVKLLDFGIAKSEVHLGGSSGTKTGAMIGTPYYMSPEQIVGAKSLDGRADLWSLGVVGYECVVGAKPFDETVFGALAIRIHSGPIPVPSSVAPDVPAAFDAWFARACARDLTVRFATAKDLADSLARVAASVGPRAAPPPDTSPTAQTVGATPYPTPPPAHSPYPGQLAPPAFAHSPHPVMTPVSAPGSVGSGPLGIHPGTNGGIGLATMAPRPSTGVGARIAALTVGLAVLAVVGAVAIKWVVPSRNATSAVNSIAATPSSAPGAAVAPPASANPPAQTAAVALPPSAESPSLPAASASQAATPTPPAPAPRTTSAKPRAAAVAPAAAPSPASPPKAANNCDPPFFFDAKGNRVFKQECL